MFKPKQLGAGRCRSEWSACSCGMKSVLIMARRNRFGNLAFHLDSQMIRQHQFPAGNTSLLSEREDGGKYRHGWVDEKPIDTVLGHCKLRVIEIIRVNRNAIHKGSKARRSFPR